MFTGRVVLLSPNVQVLQAIVCFKHMQINSFEPPILKWGRDKGKKIGEFIQKVSFCFLLICQLVNYRKSMFCSLCSVIRCSASRSLEWSCITGVLFIGFGGIFTLSEVCVGY